MSRILVDLPDSQIAALAALVESTQRSRAAVIRDAVDAYIVQHRHSTEVDVFGLWKSRKMDGLVYQQNARAEW